MQDKHVECCVLFRVRCSVCMCSLLSNAVTDLDHVAMRERVKCVSVQLYCIQNALVKSDNFLLLQYVQSPPLPAHTIVLVPFETDV